DASVILREAVDVRPFEMQQVLTHAFHAARRAKKWGDDLFVEFAVEKVHVAEAAAKCHAGTQIRFRLEQELEGSERAGKLHQELIERNPRRPMVWHLGIDDREFFHAPRIDQREVSRKRSAGVLRQHAVTLEADMVGKRLERARVASKAE